MSLLDRAFVKAYGRNQSKPVSSASVAAPHFADDRQLHSAPHDISQIESHPDASLMTGDLLDETYFRVDVGHTPIIRSIRVPKSILTNRSTDSLALPLAATNNAGQSHSGETTTKSMTDRGNVGHRMNPAAISHTLTAYDQTIETAVPYVRIDESHASRSRAQSIEQEQPLLRRVNRDVDEAQAFAIAKADAYAREQQDDQKRAEAKWFAEKTLAEQKLAELRSAERKLADLKAAERQLEALKQAEQDRIQRELDELKLANQRLAELKLAEKKLAEQRQAEPQPVGTRATDSNVSTVARSLFEKLKQKRNSPFAAVWEVDAFEFSDTIIELFSNSQLIKSIGSPLDRAVANGLKSILITSADRSVGRTSVAIGIAVSAASAGLKVVLVDADIARAGLAEAMHLDVQSDWLDAMREKLPLDEVTIRSIEDQLTVVPAIAGKGSVNCNVEQFDDMIETLRDAFDLVIIDSSPWFESVLPITQASTIDAAIVVVDVTKPNSSLVNQVQNNLRHSGITGLGIVENFG